MNAKTTTMLSEAEGTDNTTSGQETKVDEQPKNPENVLYGDDKKAEDSKEAEKPAESDKTAEDKPAEDFELTFAEGLDLDKGLLDSFKGTAKELGLNKEQAQKIADVYAEHAKKAFEAQEAELLKQQNDMIEAFKKQPDYKDKLVFAKRAVDKLASGEAKELFTKSWLGNNPDVIEFLSNVGKAISQDPVYRGEGKMPEGKDPWSILYNN